MLNTSGDLLADRRFGTAQALAAEGDNQAAAELLEQTLELVPAWAPAWLALGVARERLDQCGAAISAFRRARELDTDDGLGASLHLARLERSELPSISPGFVRALFDDYAERFDAHLTGHLHYTGPALLLRALERAGATHFNAALDLGCGTGLMARAIADRTAAIDGVDLAPVMIRQAEATGLYRRLVVGEIGAVLQTQTPGRYDAVLASDVFVYMGDLGPVAALTFRLLPPGGVFAFTVQRGAERDFEIGADMRFRHAEPYIVRTLEGVGFEPPMIDHASTRLDGGQAVPGLVVVARRP